MALERDFSGGGGEASGMKRKTFDICCKECGTVFLCNVGTKNAEGSMKDFYDSSTQETCMMIEMHIARHGADMRPTYDFLAVYPGGYQP